MYKLLFVNILLLLSILQEAFKLGSTVSLDQRVFSLLEFKWQPLSDALLRVYPRLYPVHELFEPVYIYLTFSRIFSFAIIFDQYYYT